VYDEIKMDYMEKEYLKRVVGKKTMDELEKLASLKKFSQESNVLDNSMWSNMIDGALKGLETISVMSLDWKLIGIVKLLQSWINDKREDKKKRDMEQLYGTGYESADNTTEYDPWGNTSY